MMPNIAIPEDVRQWLAGVFTECNRRVTAKLCNNPNMQEEWLDYSWIETVSMHSTPLTLASDWTVRLQAHYLGGLRHWARWEVADIGVLLFVRSPTHVARSKVALLQSKRLYPTSMAVTEETLVDYEIGFARLADPEDLAHSVAFDADYEFAEDSRYGALLGRSEQSAAISAYEREHGTPIYYQLYNPWRLPFARHVPIGGYEVPDDPLEVGVRLVPSGLVHSMLQTQPEGYRPTVHDIVRLGSPDTYGWRLENFISAELLDCREGALFKSIHQPSIYALFNRRSGPIAAAISITVEAPPGVLD